MPKSWVRNMSNGHWKVLLPVTILWLVVEGVAVYFKIGPWFA